MVMRAFVFGGKHNCSLQSVPVPTINSDEVLIQVSHCGICGTDIHIDDGEFFCKENLILGHEFSGYVAEVGADVKHLKVGDRVVGDPMTPCFQCTYCQSGQMNYCVELPGIGVNLDGAFAEYIAVPASNVHVIGDNVSMEEAAMAEPLSCAIRGMDLLKCKSGESVVIIGDGTIGLMMVQLCKLAGLAPIVLVGAKPSVAPLATRLGADVFLDGRDENIVEQVRAAVGFKQINNVIEAVGAKTTLEFSLEVATFGSKILWFGVPSPETRISVVPNEVFTKELMIQGSLMNPHTMTRAVALLNEGRLDLESLITHTFTLEELPEAFECYRNNPERIKVMIKIMR